jgi:DNA-binding CsgD family transcriptional regulator
MATTAIFAYYAFCYSAGLLGFVASFASASWRPRGPGRLRDARFAFLTASFGLMVIPSTIIAYAQSTGRAPMSLLLALGGMGLAGGSCLVIALPHFQGAFADPPKPLKARRTWIALSLASAASSIAYLALQATPRAWPLAYIILLCMIAAIVDAVISSPASIRSLSRASREAESSSPEAHDARSWRRLLRAFSVATLATLPIMLAFDFFPQWISPRIKGYPTMLKAYPLLYAFINIVYALERLKPAKGIPSSAGQPAIPSAQPSSLQEFLSALSPRESEVAALLADGATYKEICWRLGISIGTVQSHVSVIYRKLGVNCKEDLMRLMRGESTGKVPVIPQAKLER